MWCSALNPQPPEVLVPCSFEIERRQQLASVISTEDPEDLAGLSVKLTSSTARVVPEALCGCATSITGAIERPIDGDADPPVPRDEGVVRSPRVQLILSEQRLGFVDPGSVGPRM
jgi:hypothetical protein